MKTIHTNDMVRHLWANQSQPYATTSNRNLTLDGSRLVSYSTPIANMVKDKDGNRVALITTHTYSITTSGKHMPRHRDVSHITHFYVPHIGSSFGVDPADHAANMAHMIAGIHTIIGKWKRAINDPYLIHEDGEINASHHPRGIGKTLLAYAETFGLAIPADMPDVDALVADVTAIRLARRERNNTPAKLAERARRQASRDEADRIARENERKNNEERLTAWLAGEPGHFYTNTPAGGAYLRVKGNRIETSMGATVPLHQGIRLAHLCRSRRVVGEELFTSLTVGSFTLTHISAEGNARVGCHLLEWEQIEDCARRAGIDLVQTELNTVENA